MRFRWRLLVLLAALFAMIPAHAAHPSNAGGGPVNLPYSISDGKSSSWIIQVGGWLQQRRMNDDAIYQQVGMLMIDQNNPAQANNQARVDPKTNEVTIDGFQPIDGVQISRRISLRRDEEVLRCIDSFKNTGGTEASINVQYVTTLNRGVTAAQTISDPKKAGSDLAWIAQTIRGKTAVDIFAGKGAQSAGQLQWEQGSNVVQYNLQLTVPAGKTVSLMHVHAVAVSPDKGNDIVNALKASKLISDLPGDIRKSIVNFAVNRNFVDDREILRGTIFDVVELRGGDQLNGTLQEKSYKVQTMFGPIDLPADQVVGLLNVGEFRPRQLVISSQGEMIGGTLDKQTIDLQLASGQVTQIPLTQVSRVGYRKRTDEPDEWKFDKPMLILASGDRMNVQMPDAPLEVMTRFGLLKLAPTVVSSIILQGEDHGVHQIQLNNGSRFAGLLSADQLSFKLATNGMAITVPLSVIARLQFTPDSTDVPEDSPIMSLTSGDTFVGTIGGDLKLDTVFDTIKISGPQIRGLNRVKETNGDVQATLWDQTKLSGQLEESSVNCDLGGGLSVKIPVAMIDSYVQPSPLPSDQMMDKIKSIVQQLSADDWKARDQAQADLVSMGASVTAVLKQLRASQGPEAQQRIDAILKQFEKPTAPAGASVGRANE